MYLLHFFKFPENVRPVTVIPVYFELILYESSETGSPLLQNCKSRFAALLSHNIQIFCSKFFLYASIFVIVKLALSEA
jgi:hypothetical protein